MKKGLFLWWVIALTTVYAQKQSDKVYLAEEVEKVPVFPGCETLNEQHKELMNACMSRSLSD